MKTRTWGVSSVDQAGASGSDRRRSRGQHHRPDLNLPPCSVLRPCISHLTIRLATDTRVYSQLWLCGLWVVPWVNLIPIHLIIDFLFEKKKNHFWFRIKDMDLGAHRKQENKPINWKHNIWKTFYGLQSVFLIQFLTWYSQKDPFMSVLCMR